MDCPFCPAPTPLVFEDDLVAAFADAFPVSVGHTLIVPKRHVETYFEATSDERAAIWAAVDAVKAHLDAEHRPDGYNVGFNAGVAAGQTVMHVHVHVIPRYRGDMDDPRGGVRYVIPSEGNYKRDVRPLVTGGEDDPFSRHVFPLFARSTSIDIVAAFIQAPGLSLISRAVTEAVARGAAVRILTGDYLEITQARALEMLYDWERSSRFEDDDADATGEISARVVEVKDLPGRTRAFHPKAWRFESLGFGVAFVGSSNLSHSALETGIEWNLRVDRDHDRRAYERVRAAFEALWQRARPLDRAWIADYAKRAAKSRAVLPAGETEAEPLPTAPDPHLVQQEALKALRQCRDDGRQRALTVMATGLGKTWLAAFDYLQLHQESGGGTPPRLLFVAHRKEILRQAAETFRTMLRSHDLDVEVGWFLESESELDADVVFASVAKLARPAHLAKLANHRFDYVVVDEVHHAAAQSYRRILAALDPTFLLGLTATPDRADAADVQGLFDDNVAYRAGIADGISIGRLVPFSYFGVKDDIDYASIPWRNKRWDPKVLAEQAQTKARMDSLWGAWSQHPGTRSLIFCCSIEHANFVREELRARGVSINAVHSAETSDDREGSLAELRSGALDAICAVDIFNEGVDIPTVDRVVMLRPTESHVIFLQQLGRGLRAADGKEDVTVIDFVGNDRVFLERVRKLLSLGSRQGDLHGFLTSDDALELPGGCSVEIELEAKEMLSRLFKVSGADQVERAYRELRDTRRERPTAGEMFRLGYPPKPLRNCYGSWFEFLRAEGDLDDEENQALDGAAAFLSEVEVTDLTKSFKMITLQVLVENEGLISGMAIEDVALRSHAIMRRSPELARDIPGAQSSLDTDADQRQWVRYWQKNPINAWTTPTRRGRTWFDATDDMLRLKGVDGSIGPALERMVFELVDLRLAMYRSRARAGERLSSSFVCKVLWNKRDPILKLPKRTDEAEVPTDWLDVRLPDGRVWTFKFAKEFCNVARPAGTTRNQLPDLLRSWFGPKAGQPGTAFEVRFYRSPDGLWVQPIEAQVIPFGARQQIRAYPDLKAAAGHATEETDNPDTGDVLLPFARPGPDVFAVRVFGTSMDGGKKPLASGDWAVFRLVRSAGPAELADRVVLAQTPTAEAGGKYQIKRLTRVGEGWKLTSDNPSGPTIEPTEETTIVARLEASITPEELGPSVGVELHEDDLAEAFGVDVLPPRSGRHAGHLFVFVDERGTLVAPDRLRGNFGRSGETAFALSRVAGADGVWRYLGVARPAEDHEWRIPEVDFDTWRTWGTGARASRDLPRGILERAEIVASALEFLPPDDRWIERTEGRRARVLRRAARGGVVIDGGEGGFAERTISLVDIGWVLAASDDVRANGGALDEARVNRLRYLEGTPRGSTRWIDTGWALACLERAVPYVGVPVLSPALGPRVVHDRDGAQISATFSVERVADSVSVVVEAKGGKKGTPAERNTDYSLGLELILERLGAMDARITNAEVDSETTRKLPSEKRRLKVEGESYPIEIANAKALRMKLGPAMAQVGRAPESKGGGNPTKRLRLVVEVPGRASCDAVADALEGRGLRG